MKHLLLFFTASPGPRLCVSSTQIISVSENWKNCKIQTNFHGKGIFQAINLSNRKLKKLQGSIGVNMKTNSQEFIRLVGALMRQQRAADFLTGKEHAFLALIFNSFFFLFCVDCCSWGAHEEKYKLPIMYLFLSVRNSGIVINNVFIRPGRNCKSIKRGKGFNKRLFCGYVLKKCRI